MKYKLFKSKSFFCYLFVLWFIFLLGFISITNITLFGVYAKTTSIVQTSAIMCAVGGGEKKGCSCRERYLSSFNYIYPPLLSSTKGCVYRTSIVVWRCWHIHVFNARKYKKNIHRINILLGCKMWTA